jgi:hypothetical protein
LLSLLSPPAKLKKKREDYRRRKKIGGGKTRTIDIVHLLHPSSKNTHEKTEKKSSKRRIE